MQISPVVMTAARPLAVSQMRSLGQALGGESCGSMRDGSRYDLRPDVFGPAPDPSTSQQEAA